MKNALIGLLALFAIFAVGCQKTGDLPQADNTETSSTTTDEHSEDAEEMVTCEGCSMEMKASEAQHVDGKTLCSHCVEMMGTDASTTDSGTSTESGTSDDHSDDSASNADIPAGSVICATCEGHLPKAEAKTINGKTYCEACAEEA